MQKLSKIVLPMTTFKLNSGFGRQTYNLARGLRKLGIKVTIATMYFEDDLEKLDYFRQNDIEIIVMNNKRLGVQLNRMYQLSNPYIETLSNAFEVMLKNIDADFFIFPNEEALPLVKNNKFKDSFIFYHCGLWSGMAMMVRMYNSMPQLTKVGRLLTLRSHFIYARYLRSAPYIIANSRYTSFISSLSYGRLADEIIYPSVDTDVFKPVLYDENSSFIVLSVSGGDTIESRALLSKIARKKDVKLITTGLNKIENADNRGFVTSEELIELYNIASVTIFPEFNEPFGYVPVESMACGTPVIAFEDGGPAETIINNKTGWLVKNENEFLNKISNISNLPSSVLSARESIRDYVLENFSIEASSKKLLNFLSKT
ncbi:MAG: glycosyltransferase [Candidatus Thermoplasmatota archaeon]|nr:glycosyltransferase [Candidatus Thermoplasmatota archaeon]